jgi:predicted nucleic acid-binding protein
VIFVDSSFFLAVHLRRDPHHTEAERLLREVARERLVTSNHVRGETWTFLRRHAWHAVAVSFLDRLERTPRLGLEFVTPRQEEEAIEWLRRHDEREYSFVDATSFSVMRSLGITAALAFDGDFAAAGFVELRPS